MIADCSLLPDRDPYELLHHAAGDGVGLDVGVMRHRPAAFRDVAIGRAHADNGNVETKA